jgi:hypothetical protein
VNAPESVEGAAVLDAASAAIVGGEMVQPHVDLAAALAMAAAMGCPAEVAAPLLAACSEGVAMGLAERRATA